MKSVPIGSYSGPYFPAFGLNTDQNNSDYGYFLHSVLFKSSQFIRLECLNPENDLLKHLFTNYNPNARPSAGINDAVILHYDVALRQMVDLV